MKFSNIAETIMDGEIITTSHHVDLNIIQSRLCILFLLDWGSVFQFYNRFSSSEREW